MQNDQVAVLLENIDDKLQGLAEAVGVINGQLINVENTVSVIPRMAADIETIKAVQVDQGREIRHIEQYLTAQAMPARA